MIFMLTGHFTTNAVQLTYTINLQKTRKKNVREKIDIDRVKTAAWGIGIGFMNKTLPSVTREGFDLHQLEDIYLDHLPYEIFIESHITQFDKNLSERIPDYEVIKKYCVFRNESMYKYFVFS